MELSRDKNFLGVAFSRLGLLRLQTNVVTDSKNKIVQSVYEFVKVRIASFQASGGFL